MKVNYHTVGKLAESLLKKKYNRYYSRGGVCVFSVDVVHWRAGVANIKCE